MSRSLVSIPGRLTADFDAETGEIRGFHFTPPNTSTDQFLGLLDTEAGAPADRDAVLHALQTFLLGHGEEDPFPVVWTEDGPDLTPFESSKPLTAGAIIVALAAHGVKADVGHSGGGCATIYVGPTHEDDEGDTRYACLIGPGSYHVSAPTDSAFEISEDGYVSVGLDDDGESTALYPSTLDALVVAVQDVLDGKTAGPRADDPTNPNGDAR